MVSSKPKTCKYCKQKFIPERPKAICCSPDCAYDYGLKVKSRAEAIQSAQDRKTIAIRKDAIKTAREWTREAQIAFNAFIRERDSRKTCISCGASWGSGEVGGSFDCGHYRSVGSAPHLRFDERNAHGQCKKCNRYGSGMAIDYRIGLIKRIGIDSVESLESDQAPKKYTIEQLKAIKSEYKLKLKELKNGR